MVKEKQPNFLLKFCFGLGLTTLASKGLLIWATGRFYDLSDSSLENLPPEVIGPANIFVSVLAVIGLAGATVAFTRGARGHLLYASVALNSVALLAT
ncbi:MAG: hypothetical protein QGG54_06830 [Gammaproteobacteria bacterium]|nr:hypothetical protein [Gammaproteobacteria bacterium]